MKFSKCDFWLKSRDILGHIFLSKDIEVDLKKIDIVKICLRPLIPIDIIIFLGLDCYYRRFVKGFRLFLLC